MSDKAWKKFERDIAVRIGEWWLGDPKSFVRTACSGAWPKKRAEGDVVAVDDAERMRFPFCVDGKHRVGSTKFPWHLEQLLTHKDHLIVQWWREMGEIETVKKGKLRMLVASKRGVMEALAVFGRREVEWLEKSGAGISALPKVLFSFGRCEDPAFPSETLTICRFVEFLDTADAEKLKEAVDGKGR